MEDSAPYGRYAPAGFVRFAVTYTRALPDTWLTRRLIILLRRLVGAVLRGAPVDIEVFGVRMRLRPYRNICEKRLLFAPATFDPEELALLSARMGDGFRFIDIGANVGAYSLYVASRAGPTARILAVEPQPRMFERLIYNLRLNAFATVKAIDCAVADRSGELTLFLDERNSGESSVKLVTHSGATPIRVLGKTLHQLLEEEGFDRVDGMKLDVEGAEDLVLGPFLQSAPRHLFPALLILEKGARQWQVDLVALLERAGYRLVSKTRLNLVYELRDEAPAETAHD